MKKSRFFIYIRQSGVKESVIWQLEDDDWIYYDIEDASWNSPEFGPWNQETLEEARKEAAAMQGTFIEFTKEEIFLEMI